MLKKRSEAILQKCYNCKHRHIVFTISDYLWDIFRKDRKLIDLIFRAVSTTLLSWFKSRSKKEHYTPGIIAILHTYGREIHTFILSLLKELWVILISLRSLILFLMMPFAKDFKKFY